jgi:hypothetical protein
MNYVGLKVTAQSLYDTISIMSQLTAITIRRYLERKWRCEGAINGHSNSVADPHQSYADPDPKTCCSPDLDPPMLQKNLQGFLLFTSMLIRARIQLSTLIRIRIHLPKMMRIRNPACQSIT